MTPPVTIEASYVLLKRGLFYGPNNQGYTGVLRKAGRYTREDAESRVDHCAPAVTMMLASEAPDYSPACWHEVQVADLLDLLRIEREAKEAALAAHQQVTAERDADRAELARLRAEGEAKDRARWLPIATAPTDRPVVVRMRTDRLQGGWFVATVTLPDPDDDSRFGSCSTIWHYNGEILQGAFRGTWTDWLDDGGSEPPALARAATAREGAPTLSPTPSDSV